MRFTWFHVFLVLLCLVPFVYAMQFAFPAGDDFLRSLKARYVFDLYEGLHEMLRAWWKWSGRYTHHFLVVFFGDLTLSQAGYTAGALGLALVYGIGFMGLFATLSASDRPTNWIVPALFALFAVYGGMQTLDSVAYLLTDILGIGIGSAMLIWFLWGLCRLWYAERLTPSHLWFPAVTGVLAVGCYEHSALATLIATAGAWALARYCHHPHKQAFSRLGVIICIAVVLSFFTRGNFRRQTKRGVDMGSIMPQILRFGADWLEAVFWYLRSVFPLAALAVALAVSPKKRTGLRPVPSVFLLVGAVLAAIALSGGITLVHAVSDVPITMTGKLPANLALLGGVLTAALLLPLCGPLRALCRACVPGLVFIVAALAAVIVWAPNTLDTVAALTSGETVTVYREYQQRMAVLREAARVQALDPAQKDSPPHDPISLAPLSSLPYPVRPGEPFPPDEKMWPNPHAADMYGVSALRAAPAPLPELFPYLPGTTSGMTSGTASGMTSGTASGMTSGTASGTRLADTSATASGNTLNTLGNTQSGVHVPGLGTVRLVHDAGPNPSYAAEWLLIEPEPGLSAVPTLELMIVAAPGPGRLLPVWLQRVVLGDPGTIGELLPRDARFSTLAAKSVLYPDLRTRFFAFTRTVQLRPSGAVLLASAHPTAGGPVSLFVSADQGKSFTRVSE